MNTPIPVRVPWSASKWRGASVGKILGAREFRAFILNWQKANNDSGSTESCFNVLTTLAGAATGDAITPKLLSEIAEAAIARIDSGEFADDPVGLFCQATVLHNLVSTASIPFPPALRRNLAPVLDFLAGTIYRTAMIAVGQHLGCDLPDIMETDLLPGRETPVPVKQSAGTAGWPGGVSFGLN